MTTTRPRPRAKTAKADAPAEAAAAATLFTPAIARKIRQEGPPTTRFTLTATGPGLFAEVRSLDFTNPDVLTLLPQHLLSFALKLSMDTESGIDPTRNEDGTVNPERALQLLADEQELSRTLCILGFVSPKLAATEDTEGTNTVWVGDIHPSDRRRFMFFCMNPFVEEADSLATFPG